MSNDEQSIRDLIARWREATLSGDLSRVLELMAEDVVFLTAGRPPMRGRAEFASRAAGNPPGMKVEQEIEEIRVEGNFAYAWTRLTVAMTPPGGVTARRSGQTLSIFRKEADGRWVLFRDANLLAPEPATM